uniref:Serpin 6 n=1 Tax=Hemiscolopendra marginata TaxID=943146 RepID=A0A646QD79_9MYRI
MKSRQAIVAILVVLFGMNSESSPIADSTKSAAVRSNNEFALDLLKTLSTSNSGENVFFSPLSISAAVAMTSLGAGGSTLDEIDNAFHFNEVKKTYSDPMALHETFQKTMSLFAEKNSNYSLTIANRLFSQEGFEILKKFLNETDNYYKATIQSVNFGSGQAEGIINEWVEKQTNNKIKDLFIPGSLSSAVLALVNAIYFKGNWKNQFDKDITTDMDFHTSSNEKKTVKMMSLKKTFPYAEDNDLKVQLLELPYAGNDLSMVVILPQQGALSSLTTQLTAEKFENLMKQLDSRKVNVKLPKFKLETKYSLVKTLQQLGVNSLFSNSADLSGISDAKLKVSEVIHKAFIETDEEGTEAAAATGISFVRISVLIPKELDPDFIADHPFLFAIVDKRLSNQILFMGTLIQP